MRDALLVVTTLIVAIGVGVYFGIVVGDSTPYEPLMRFTTTTIEGAMSA